MKKSFLAAAASMLGIIVIRMILSVTVSEHVADIFTNVSLTALFLFFIIQSMSNKSNKGQ